MPDDRLESQDLLGRYQAGDANMAEEIFKRYARRLVELARSRIAPSLGRRVDAEDIVQSAYRSFFLHAREGEFHLARPGDLWRLLAAITLHKLRDQAARHRAGRRDYRREREPIDDDAASAFSMIPQAREASPAELAAAVDELRRIVTELGDGVGDTLALRVAGATVEEIAVRMDCSPRTVRRRLDQARHELERRLADDPTKPTVELPALAIDPAAALRHDDYILLNLIGRGGMGRVYRARERATGDFVAIKALRKDRQRDPRAVRRFLHEAELVGRLRHPGIVGVRGVGRFPAGGYFMALDFVAGGDLRQCIADGSCGVGETARIAMAVAEAIAFAHEHRVLHCDLKPENVLLDGAGRVFVTDFGFGQLAPRDGIAVPQLSVGGSWPYMAPEVRQGGEATTAVDVYGLGVVLSAMLAAPRSTHRERNNTNGNERVTNLAATLASIAARCLAEQPSGRYDSAAQVADAISVAIRDERNL